jgi:hypothetical protein
MSAARDRFFLSSCNAARMSTGTIVRAIHEMKVVPVQRP